MNEKLLYLNLKIKSFTRYHFLRHLRNARPQPSQKTHSSNPPLSHVANRAPPPEAGPSRRRKFLPFGRWPHTSNRNVAHLLLLSLQLAHLYCALCHSMETELARTPGSSEPSGPYLRQETALFVLSTTLKCLP